MGTFASIKLITKNILFKIHVVSLFLRVRPSHQKSDVKSIFLRLKFMFYRMLPTFQLFKSPVEREVILRSLNTLIEENRHSSFSIFKLTSY